MPHERRKVGVMDPRDLRAPAGGLVVVPMSRSTRHTDLGRKRVLYAAGGVRWYWVVDLHDETLIEFDNIDGTFTEALRFTSGTTHEPLAITVTVAEL